MRIYMLRLCQCLEEEKWSILYPFQSQGMHLEDAENVLINFFLNDEKFKIIIYENQNLQIMIMLWVFSHDLENQQNLVWQHYGLVNRYHHDLVKYHSYYHDTNNNLIYM